MERDCRPTALYHRIEALSKTLHQFGTQEIRNTAEVYVPLDVKHAVFAGDLTDKLANAATHQVRLI